MKKTVQLMEWRMLGETMSADNEETSQYQWPEPWSKERWGSRKPLK